MKKKLIFIILFLLAFTLGVIGFSAFEAHIINVTATIENSLSVDAEHIDYGTVYPQEMLEEGFSVVLSESFLAQDRVGQVDYVLRQKPKCWSESLMEYGVVAEDENGIFYCKDEGDFTILPLLCPYLSKSETTTDGEAENDGGPILPFHGSTTNWTMADTVLYQAQGRLVLDSDPNDAWLIDLKVPCFEGSCAQDWVDFVLAANPEANPDDYILKDVLSGEMLGCDLWLEVSGIEENNGSGGPDCNPEVCNGLDDDCDGQIDEDWADLGNSCNVGTGECNVIGTLVCNPGNPSGLAICDAVPGSPSAEICDDGVDNSCNGDVDCQDAACTDDPACQTNPSCTDNDGDTFSIELSGCGLADCDDSNGDVYPGATEVCNGLDDNCDGNTDEGWPTLGETCSVGLGICEASGNLICNSGDPSGAAVCDATPGPSGTEVCNGLDDDCDGSTDENWADLGNSCSVGVGECEASGIFICNANQTGLEVCDALPGTPVTEICDDGLDNDCDTFIDCNDSDCSTDAACVSAPSQAGDIVITEIMQNPSAVADNKGEWFEILNTTSNTLDLDDCVVSDDGSSFTITSYTIAGNSYAVFAKNQTFANNGGVNVDYNYPNSFTLVNDDDDKIIITCDTTEIDRVEFGDNTTFPDPTGASMSLANPSLDNNVGTNWCEAKSYFGDGDLGTPGAENDSCSATAIYFADLESSEFYSYLHNYENAKASMVFETPTNNSFTGKISAVGMKPYQTYQIKFEGKPECLVGSGGNDLANEYIGNNGRWTCTDCGGTALSRNRSDAQYEANKLLADSDPSKECIAGYLVWDFFTVNGDGVATGTVMANNTYHVLRCAGGACPGVGDAFLSNPDGDNPGTKFCAPEHVSGELEPGRPGCNAMALNSASYDLNIVLTEESFHQGNWATVMGTDISFTIN